jgi:uncharacterized OB-fold protein
MIAKGLFMFCEQCGSKLQPKLKFCNSCGFDTSAYENTPINKDDGKKNLNFRVFFNFINSILNFFAAILADLMVSSIPKNNNRPFGKYSDNIQKYSNGVPCNVCTQNVAWGVKNCPSCGAKKPHLNFQEEYETSKIISKWVIIFMGVGAIMSLFEDSPEYKDCLRQMKRGGIPTEIGVPVCKDKWK